MGIVEDHVPLFADFGLDATIGGHSVRGIYDESYQDVLGIVSGSTPVLLIATSDENGVVVGNSVTINNVAHTVASVQRDGTGMTRLFFR